jgi:hypothetical protein
MSRDGIKGDLKQRYQYRKEKLFEKKKSILKTLLRDIYQSSGLSNSDIEELKTELTLLIINYNKENE